MPLRYSAPPDNLARELREVARDAHELIEALTTGLNYELPPGFPAQQLLEISTSLSQLEAGTAEGCKSPLEYARNRLPAIRREFLLSEELEEASTDPDRRPQAARGTSLDQRLKNLISSATTALDEYRLHASAELPADEELDAETEAPLHMGETARKKSLEVERRLLEAKEVTLEATRSDSVTANDLLRQINDGEGQNRVVRAELGLRRPVVNWLRNLVSVLGRYPAVISETAKRLDRITDFAEKGFVIWSEYNKAHREALFGSIRKLCKLTEEFAEDVEKRRKYPVVHEPLAAAFNLPLRLVSLPEKAKIIQLSKPLLNLLNGHGIITIGDLFAKHAQIRDLKGIGPKSIGDIADFLDLIRPITGEPSSQTAIPTEPNEHLRVAVLDTLNFLIRSSTHVDAILDRCQGRVPGRDAKG